MFPSFQLNQLFGSIAGGGEVTWKSFHDLFERDCSLDANLHKAQILNDKVTSRELQKQCFGNFCFV